MTQDPPRFCPISLISHPSFSSHCALVLSKYLQFSDSQSGFTLDCCGPLHPLPRMYFPSFLTWITLCTSRFHRGITSSRKSLLYNLLQVQFTCYSMMPCAYFYENNCHCLLIVFLFGLYHQTMNFLKAKSLSFSLGSPYLLQFSKYFLNEGGNLTIVYVYV